MGGRIAASIHACLHTVSHLSPASKQGSGSPHHATRTTQPHHQLYRDTGVILSLCAIPDDVLRQLSIQRATSGAEANDAQREAHEKLAPVLPPRLLGALAPFQKEGAAFVVGRGGRGLIADEMGAFAFVSMGGVGWSSGSVLRCGGRSGSSHLLGNL